jgi:REP element-mobilizing transposase RayT
VPRLPRSQLPELGFFHVTSRGVGGAFIFLDDWDREAFRVLLMQVVERFGWRLHAWCLMGTHYHLLVEAPRDRLSAGMHRLNGLFAQSFNRRQGRRGHLFEQRFSAWVVDEESHFWATVNYIVENPVRAGLCTDPRDWLWSWPRVGQPVSAPQTVALTAMSEGLSLGHGWSGGARTTWTSPGPCTPTTSFCSMSALRLGPVTIASALGSSPPSASNSSASPGRILSSASSET